MTSGTKKTVSKYAGVVVLCAFLINLAANYPLYQLSPLIYIIVPKLDLNSVQCVSLFSAVMIPGIFAASLVLMIPEVFKKKEKGGDAARSIV